MGIEGSSFILLALLNPIPELGSLVTQPLAPIPSKKTDALRGVTVGKGGGGFIGSSFSS